MRMWMVDPKIMCRKHLLGEHVELHMFIGAIEKGKSIQGFIDNNCFEPNVVLRHDALVAEMKRRRYSHSSYLPKDMPNYENLLENWSYNYIDREKSLKDLIERCPVCASRYATQF